MVKTLIAVAAGASAALSALVMNTSQGAVAPAPVGAQLRSPEPPPLLLRPVSKDDALEINQRIPFSDEVSFAAAPFHFRGTKEARFRALQCLTAAVYHEAGYEGADGGRAVAQVVLNRVRHPAFPSSICGVVYQGSTRPTGCQFSFTCDGALARIANRAALGQAAQIAQQALAGTVFKPVGLATHYHANYVVPYWAASLEKNSQVGVHIFYRWPGGWGTPAAFRQRSSGVEENPAELRAAALMAEGIWPGIVSARKKPAIALSASPTVELAGVITLLATPPGGGDSEYARRVRARFASYTDHPAVAILRSLREPRAAFGGTPAPAPAAYLHNASAPIGNAPTAQVADPAKARALFPGAIADFAQRTDFAGFYRDQRTYYQRQTAGLDGSIARSGAEWETYTGMKVPAGRVILSFALPKGGEQCIWDGMPAPEQPLLAAPVGRRADAAELFLLTAGRDLLSGSSARRGAISAQTRNAIVRAVFTRIHALMRGDQAEPRGSDVQSVLERRLRFYERHRDQYRTLAAYLPTLLAGIGSNAEAGGALSADIGRGCASAVVTGS